MSGPYAVDTNLYIQAFCNVAAREELKQFHLRMGSGLYFNAVVYYELRAGVRIHEQQMALEDIVAPFREQHKLIVPSFSAYDQAGRVLSDLVNKERLVLTATKRSLLNDALIAASCREAKVALITSNSEDFTAIKRHLRGFNFVSKWP